MKKLLNKVEKATGLDLDGDGKIGGRTKGVTGASSNYYDAGHQQQQQQQQYGAPPPGGQQYYAPPPPAQYGQGAPVAYGAPAPSGYGNGGSPPYAQAVPVGQPVGGSRPPVMGVPVAAATAAIPPPPPTAPPRAPAVAPLPSGWEEKTDPSTGRVFYIDHNTRTTHWERPAAPSLPPPPATAAMAMGVPVAAANNYAPAQYQQAQPVGYGGGGGLAHVPASGRRRSLLIGINYTGSRAALRGCINDVTHMKQLLVSQGFPQGDAMVVLTDDQRDPNFRPTKANILRAMAWLVTSVAAGDCLFFHFSGHGGQQRDQTGMEDDGYDETILPVDFERAGQITDDQIWNTLVRPLPNGVRLTALMDCCHSGTGMDLPFFWMPGYSRWTEDDNPCHSAGDVQLFSGCADSECSSDGDTHLFKVGGAMTGAFIRAFEAEPFQTYPAFMASVQQGLRQRGFRQRPQLSSSQAFDLNMKVFTLTDGIEPNRNQQMGRQMRKRKKPKRDMGNMNGMLGLVGGAMVGMLVAEALF